MSERLPELELAHPEQELTGSAQGEDQYVELLHDANEGEENGNMTDTSMLHRPRPKKAQRLELVTQKGSRRTSETLDALAAELHALEISHDPQQRPQSILSDPYESYVSSEEDASEHTDDYDESLELGSDTQSIVSQASRRGSQQDTARAVSMIFAGKPHIVDIYHTRSLSADGTSTSSSRRPPPLRLDSKSSGSSKSSSSPTRSTSMPLMPTTSFAQVKKRSGIKGLASLATKWPSSAHNDSTSAGSSHIQSQPSSHMSISASKTPTSRVQAAWKDSKKNMSRKLSMARKHHPAPKGPASPYSGNFKSFSTNLLSLGTSTDADNADDPADKTTELGGSAQRRHLRRPSTALSRLSLHIDLERLALSKNDAKSKEPSPNASQTPSIYEDAQDATQELQAHAAPRNLRTKSSMMGLSSWFGKTPV